MSSKYLLFVFIVLATGCTGVGESTESARVDEPFMIGGIAAESGELVDIHSVDTSETASTNEYTDSNIDESTVPEKAKTQQFIIRQGTLRENARRFIEANGWAIAGHDYWQADNFSIDTDYPLNYTSIDDGLVELLANYPVKAQLVEINQTVVFVKRRHHREGP